MLELKTLIYLLINIHVATGVYKDLGEICDNNIQCTHGSGGKHARCSVICRCKPNYIDCNGAASGGTCIAERAANPCTTTPNNVLSSPSSAQRTVTEVTTKPITVDTMSVGSASTSQTTAFTTSPMSITTSIFGDASNITTPSHQAKISSSPQTSTVLPKPQHSGTKMDRTLILLSCIVGLLTLNTAFMSIYCIKRHFSAKNKVHNDCKEAKPTPEVESVL